MIDIRILFNGSIFYPIIMQLGGLGMLIQGLHQHGHQITQTQGAGVVVESAFVVVVVSPGGRVVVVVVDVVGSNQKINCKKF